MKSHFVGGFHRHVMKQAYKSSYFGFNKLIRTFLDFGLSSKLSFTTVFTKNIGYAGATLS